MNSRDGFKAARWLTHSQEAKALEKSFSAHSEIDFFSSSFKPSDFFIPGWKGEGLISSSAIQIKNTIQNLSIDALSQYKTFNQSNRSLKLYVYNEFQSYIQYRELELPELKNFNDFWFHFQDHTSPYKKELEDFSKIYCFRVVAIFLFRVKFLLDLSREITLIPTDDNLINPLSYLGKIFKKDSSTELSCECLSTNQYSWYRPSFEFKSEAVKLRDVFQNITLTELIKIFSTTDTDRIYSLSNYSHSLSHVAMGRLINELSIKLPKWLDPQGATANSRTAPSPMRSRQVKVLNTLFVGKNISSLALSHWLAQDHNMKDHWDHLICPDFKGNEFMEGVYFKVCQELQYLSFLSKIAVEQGHETIPFICKVMKEKYQTSDEAHQASFFQNAQGLQETLYDRIVLNLTDLPKTNPHFYVIQQIMNLKSSLKNEGRIILMTNQKIFVPSQSEKVQQLLKDFKIECQFSLEDLRGKGELAQFIFLLTKRELPSNFGPKDLTFKAPRELKETCHSFILSGELTRFNKFHLFVDELKTFIKEKSSHTSSFHQRDIESKLNFDYHIDAIISGKLVSSTTKDSSNPKIHSNFFRNLYNSCIALEKFFHIEQIDPQAHLAKPAISSELLGIKAFKTKYPLILIVNASSASNIKLELLDGEQYQAKLEAYGTAFFSYFGLTQKVTDINLNVFREYFQSSVGNQVIQLQLSDVQTKLKAKLKSLLIPRFFLQTQFIPTSELGVIQLLVADKNKLLSKTPDSLMLEYEKAITHLESLQREYSWHALGLLSYFNVTVSNILNEGFEKSLNRYNFTNPLISSELLKLKTGAIYPKNNDVYIEFMTASTEELHAPLTQVIQKIENEDSATLILKSEQNEIVTMHSRPAMIAFIKFILDSALNYKIADIITSLKVPSLQEMENILNNYSFLENTLTEIKTKNEFYIASLLNSSINSQK